MGQLGAGSGTEGVQAGSEPALQLVGLHGWGYAHLFGLDESLHVVDAPLHHMRKELELLRIVHPFDPRGNRYEWVRAGPRASNVVRPWASMFRSWIDTANARS